MNAAGIYFFALLVSGLASLVLGILYFKDLWGGGRTSTAVVVQTILVLWFVLFLALWIRASNPQGSAAIMTVGVTVLLAVMHAPVFISFLAGAATDAFQAIVDPSSGVHLQKTYDLAEKAEAEHNYETALKLYREELARDENDFEAQIRIAELLIKLSRPDDAVTEFSNAANMEDADEEDMLYAAIRASEILEKDPERKDDASAPLKNLLQKNISEKIKNNIRQRFT